MHCSLNSPSNDGGSMAESFNEKDEDYVSSSVIEAGMFSYYMLIQVWSIRQYADIII